MSTIETPVETPACFEIENIGPIRHLKFPMPEGGGMIVIKGRNGEGKSTVLNAIDKVMGKDVKVRKNDSVPGSGHVTTPLGVSLKVTRQMTKRDGDELTVEILNDEFSIADMVDPREKDPAAADRRGIKALLRTANAAADISLFEQLFISPEECERIISDETRKTDDLIQMSSRVKEDIEREARGLESQSKLAESEILRLEGSLRDVDLSTEYDLPGLKKQHEQAVTRLANLRSARNSWLVSQDEAVGVKERIEKVQRDGAAPIESLESELQCRTKDYDDACSELCGIKAEIKRLEEIAKEKENSVALLKSQIDTAQANLESARKSEQIITELKDRLFILKRAAEVKEEEIESANQEAEEIVNQITTAEIQQQKRSTIEDLTAKRKAKKKLDKKSEELRDAAKATDGVLTEIVKSLGTPIKIGYDEKDNPRMQVYHEGRNRDVFFSELSKGERLSLVLEVAIKAVGPGGLITIPQELNEGLDEINRAKVAEQLHGTGVVAITAQCDAGDLRAEVM